MLLSKCVLCDSKKSRFIKQQEASGFLEDIIKAIISPFIDKNWYNPDIFITKNLCFDLCIHLKKVQRTSYDCMFLSSHARVSEWIHTL